VQFGVAKGRERQMRSAFSDHIRAAFSSAVLVAVCVMAIVAGLCSTALAAEYKLGAGDKIRVVVLADPEFSGEYEVDATGNISARMVGRLSVIGMTTAELEAALTERYRSSGYLRNPRISVELLSARPFFIMGEIIKPGSYPYVAGLTVAQAIAIAGGYTRRASSGRIKIKRFGSVAGSEESVTEDSTINPGDIVRVPERFF
jgi:protein involved in polysaccharide export with SLBB domain